jgi:hypothetical protein
MRDITLPYVGARTLNKVGHLAHESTASHIAFQPQCTPAQPSLASAIDGFAIHVVEQVERLEATTRKARTVRERDGLGTAARAIATNLLRASLAGADALAIPLSDDVHRRTPRYRPTCYGKAFTDLLGGVRQEAQPAGFLYRLGLVHLVKAGFNVSRFGRQSATLISPTTVFLARFSQEGVTLKDFLIGPPNETIILKDGDGKRIDYTETQNTARWREQMATINGAIAAFDIDLVDEGDKYDEDGRVFLAAERGLYRVFNGAWDRGGRMYGSAFWLNLPREKRKLIRIDGQPVCTVDFTAFNVHASYATAGAAPPEDDPYDIKGDDHQLPNWAARREAAKLIMSALFGADKELTRWPGWNDDDIRSGKKPRVQAAFPPGTSLRTVIAEMAERHHPIAEQFCKGIWLSLNFIESEIAVATLRRLHVAGIPALPLHDCCICKVSDAETVARVMVEEARRIAKGNFPVKITEA